MSWYDNAQMPQNANVNKPTNKSKKAKAKLLLRSLLLDDVLLHRSNYSPKYVSFEQKNKKNAINDEFEDDCCLDNLENSREISNRDPTNRVGFNNTTLNKHGRSKSHQIPPIVYSTISNLQKQCIQERQQRGTTREYNCKKIHSNNRCGNFSTNNNTNNNNNNNDTNDNGSNDSSCSQTNGSSSKRSSKRGVLQDGLSNYYT